MFFVEGYIFFFFGKVFNEMFQIFLFFVVCVEEDDGSDKKLFICIFLIFESKWFVLQVDICLLGIIVIEMVKGELYFLRDFVSFGGVVVEYQLLRFVMS